MTNTSDIYWGGEHVNLINDAREYVRRLRALPTEVRPEPIRETLVDAWRELHGDGAMHAALGSYQLLRLAIDTAERTFGEGSERAQGMVTAVVTMAQLINRLIELRDAGEITGPLLPRYNAN